MYAHLGQAQHRFAELAFLDRGDGPDMILLHCDTPGAAEMAQGVVRALARLGVAIRPLKFGDGALSHSGTEP